MIQIMPQMRILVAVEAADFRKGIDGLAQLCQTVLQRDPFNGGVFVFRNRRATAVKVLVYDQQLSPEARLHFHQAQSGPIMQQLREWLTAQFEDRRVEPNSALGEASTYLRKHWEELTLFLRQPGAPLDNNVCERALKRAILHRKNALFFKTCHGARVGDLFLSLIHACQFCGANPVDYLSELQNHAAELSANPARWTPWNYRAALTPTAPPPRTVT